MPRPIDPGIAAVVTAIQSRDARFRIVWQVKRNSADRNGYRTFDVRRKASIDTLLVHMFDCHAYNAELGWPKYRLQVTPLP